MRKPLSCGELRSVEADLRSILKAKSSSVIPGQNYNQVRYSLAEGDEAPLFFEALLKDPVDEVLATGILPSFVRYLKSKRLNPERPRGVVVALFYLDECYLMDGEALITLYCERVQQPRSAFSAACQTWLSETA